MVHLKGDLNWELDFEESRKDRFSHIIRSVRYAYQSVVEGDIAEFGLANGSSFRAIARTMKACEDTYKGFLQTPKALHGFDSFEGFPASTLPADLDSPMVKLGIWGKGKSDSLGITSVFDMAKEALPPERVHLYPGWFQETLPTIGADVKFAVVHLDCDLYESTAQVLEHLVMERHLADGCILLFDDFLENRGSPSFGQRKAWAECVERHGLRTTDLGPYSVSSWRFIVHVS